MTKHKTFISFYHYDDDGYREVFEEHFGHLMICKSVGDGEIGKDNSDDYIKRLIREGYITDASVLIVLIGQNTRKRKHVDWEISAGIGGYAGGHSGLIGIALPELPMNADGKYQYSDMPVRFADNLKSGYASVAIPTLVSHD